MKKTIFINAVLVFVWLFSLNVFANDVTIKLVSANASGQTELKDGKISGAFPEFFKRASQKTNVTFDYHIMPWARAVNKAEKSDDFIIFPLTRNEARENRFTWLAKIQEDSLCFFAIGNAANSYEEAKKRKRVVVWRGSSNFGLLKNLGFTNLIQVHKVDKLVNILSTDLNAVWLYTCNQAQNFVDTGKSKVALKIGETVHLETIWLAGGKGFKTSPQANSFFVEVTKLGKTNLLNELIENNK